MNIVLFFQTLYWKFFRRFKNRLKYCFSFRDIFDYEYESCCSCGNNYRVCVNWKDETWVKVNGKEDGCLCVDCFLKKAEEKGISIEHSDIELMFLFNTKGRSLDIINVRNDGKTHG